MSSTVRLADGAALTRVALVEERRGRRASRRRSRRRSAQGAARRLRPAARRRHGAARGHRRASPARRRDCRLDGAFLLSRRAGSQHRHHVDHAALGGTTRELFKGVAAGRAHGAFQGRIIGPRRTRRRPTRSSSAATCCSAAAPRSTPSPSSKSSPTTSNAATAPRVGDLDEAALFYLRARGIPTEEARRMLIEGFLREAVERVDDAGDARASAARLRPPAGSAGGLSHDDGSLAQRRPRRRASTRARCAATSRSSRTIPAWSFSTRRQRAEAGGR